jgi:hypothetical protein
MFDFRMTHAEPSKASYSNRITIASRGKDRKADSTRKRLKHDRWIADKTSDWPWYICRSSSTKGIARKKATWPAGLRQSWSFQHFPATMLGPEKLGDRSGELTCFSRNPQKKRRMILAFNRQCHV